VLARRGGLPPEGPTQSSRDPGHVAQHAPGRYSEPYGATGLVHGLIDFPPAALPRRQLHAGSLVATYSLQTLLDENVPWWFAQDNALSLLDRDDDVVAQRAAGGPGRGVYTHKRALDLPGARSCSPPTASRARRSCCRTCWSAR
jgi:two-component system sensor histidine kinase DctS